MIWWNWEFRESSRGIKCQGRSIRLSSQLRSNVVTEDSYMDNAVVEKYLHMLRVEQYQMSTS